VFASQTCTACIATRGNNVEKNDEQRERQKLLGGITGRGFLPGQSSNPKGRPHTKGLLTALRNKVGETTADGRTIEEQLVEVLVHEALVGKIGYRQSRLFSTVWKVDPGSISKSPMSPPSFGTKK
jgi:hypothetical protein